MVKFKIPGNRISIRMSDGHSYVGECVYDNDLYHLSLEEIKPFIIDEEKKIEEKVIEKPKEVEPVNLNSELKNKLKLKTVKELKELAKTIGLKVKAPIKESELIDLLVKNGYHE